MLLKIDRLIRKIYFKFFIGLPLLIITVSPYGDQSDQKNAKGKKALYDYSSNLMNSLFSAPSEESDDPSGNIFLTQAPLVQDMVNNDYSKIFMPLDELPSPTFGSENSTEFEAVLREYLDYVDSLISQKEYPQALKELDKAVIISPLNPRVRFLKQKLNGLIEKALNISVVHQDRSVLSSPIQKSNVRKKLPFMSLDRRVIIEPVEVRENTDVSLEQLKESALLNAERLLLGKFQPNNNADFDIEENIYDFRDEVGAQEETFINFEVSEDLYEESSLPKSFPDPSPLYENITNIQANNHSKTYDFVMRGKKYFQQGNFSLALISFSKARQLDEDDKYYFELQNLIRMTKDKLGNLI